MDKWNNFVTAQYLQSHWKILPAELLDFINTGLPVYRQTGIIIEAEELLPEKTLSDITKELVLRALMDSEAKKSRSFITLANIPSSFHPRDFKNTKITIAPSTPFPAATETLSDINGKAKRVFEKLRKQKDNQTLANLNTFLFKRDDINQFAKLHELKLIDEDKAPQENATEVKDSDGFIRSLQVSFVSDTEIKIKAENKKSKTYSNEYLGFNRENTKEWGTLIQILQSKDHIYHVGKAYGMGKIRNKKYDANRSMLRVISKKLISFLNVTHRQKLPGNFQIFEIIKSEKSGTYGPKFTISNLNTENAHYDNYPKDELIEEIEKLCKQRDALTDRGDKDSENKLLKIINKLQDAITTAVIKEWIPQHRATSYLNPSIED